MLKMLALREVPFLWGRCITVRNRERQHDADEKRSATNSRRGRKGMAARERPFDVTVLCSRAIVGWHAKIGIEEWQSRFGDERNDGFARYESAVKRFHESDLSDPAVQRAIAKEQISGSMEWAYAMPLPEEIWEIAREGQPVERPCQHLGELARELELALRDQDSHRADGRQIVRFTDREDLYRKAREAYAGVAGEDVQGVGGASFLLSCSLERSDSHHRGELTLLFPEALGVKRIPPDREGDLLNQLGSDALEIMDVTGSS